MARTRENGTLKELCHAAGTKPSSQTKVLPNNYSRLGAIRKVDDIIVTPKALNLVLITKIMIMKTNTVDKSHKTRFITGATQQPKSNKSFLWKKNKL